MRRTVKLCREITDKPVIVRLDSCNDAGENVVFCLKTGLKKQRLVLVRFWGLHTVLSLTEFYGFMFMKVLRHSFQLGEVCMKKRTRAVLCFVGTLLLMLLLLGVSIVRNSIYNNIVHQNSLSGSELFNIDANKGEGVAVGVVARSDTWSKIFDLNNEGITENNYQAYIYDYTVANNTGDEVDDFSFTFVFSEAAYLSSAWNGALEVHQNVKTKEIVDTVPDLRQFSPEKHKLETVSVDGESFIPMKPGDYIKYIPSTSMNALEMPIKPYEGTTPGLIMYVEIGKTIENSSLEIDYSFNRLLTSEPLFWVSLVGMAIWFIALIIYIITSVQIRRYQERHERDNEIIRESIETFSGFIDAKDKYTNGHSKRVAVYTRMIAKEFGYSGEELDRIYYVALLHDCGKIGVPDNILGKPGRLTDEEFEIIKSHTVRGGDILSNFKSLENAGEGARYHHERYDGKGYPEGKVGEDIPFIARMICVADSFDAMNTNRVYRKKLSMEKIISEIESNKGRQFDPKVADVMLGLLRDGKIGGVTEADSAN